MLKLGKLQPELGCSIRSATVSFGCLRRHVCWLSWLMHALWWHHARKAFRNQRVVCRHIRGNSYISFECLWQKSLYHIVFWIAGTTLQYSRSTFCSVTMSDLTFSGSMIDKRSYAFCACFDNVTWNNECYTLSFAYTKHSMTNFLCLIFFIFCIQEKMPKQKRSFMKSETGSSRQRRG